jgi:hypothetical protein
LTSAQQKDLRYPITPFLASAKGITSALGMDRLRKDAYATDWSLSWQALLPWRLTTTASYVGAQGTHLQANTYVNLIDPVEKARPYPAFGQIPLRQNTNSSTMNAIAILMQRQLLNGLQLSGGYTLSHEIDDGVAGDGLAVAPENPACPGCNRASGDADVRHTGTVYSVYQLPWGSERGQQLPSDLFNRIAGNWSLLSTYTARSGLPVNVTIDRSAADVATGYTVNQRPDRVPGVSLTPPAGRTLEEWINPAAFTTVAGVYGDAGRNIARGPEAWQIDSGLLRAFELPKDVRIFFEANCQNVLNHAQYGQPLGDWSTAQFGEIITPANPTRLGIGGPRSLFFSISASF